MYQLIAPYYDAIHKEIVEDSQFLLTLLNNHKGWILDLGCGSGRLTNALLNAGHPVIGLDNSSEMLNRLREKEGISAAVEAGSLILIEEDMQTFSLPVKNIPFALFGYNTAMHFPEPTLSTILSQVSQHLATGGELLIDMINPFILHDMGLDSEDFIDEYRLEIDDRPVEVATRMAVDRDEQRFEVNWRFQETTHTIDASEEFVYLFPHQLQLILEQCRFQLTDMWGDYLFNPFDEESDRLILLAKKRD